MRYRYTFTIPVAFEVETNIPDGSGSLTTNGDGTYTFTRNGQPMVFTPSIDIPTGSGVMVQQAVIGLAEPMGGGGPGEEKLEQ